MPEKCLDPVVVGAEIVTQLQSIVSRSLPPSQHGVVSVTEFLTDGARNIIPSNVTIRGDCRGFSNQVSKTIEQRMRTIVEGICSAHGTKGHVEYSTSFRPVVNEVHATDVISQAAKEVGHLETNYGRVGFSEDFAEYLFHRPGAFILMGNGTEGRASMPLHNPSYDFNDDAIEYGVSFWVALARRRT